MKFYAEDYGEMQKMHDKAMNLLTERMARLKTEKPELVGANKAYGAKSPARLGFVLSWISLMIGAVFGVILGLFISNGEVPGLSDVTAARVADAHPPAMLIGYLLLAAFATST